MAQINGNVVTVNKKLPTAWIEIMGKDVEVPDVPAVIRMLNDQGVTAFEATLGGLMQLIRHLNIPNAEAIIDALVADEPDQETMQVLRSIRQEWVVVTFVDPDNVQVAVRIHKNDIARAAEILEQ